jgi:signal transduction histidine kinase
MNKLGCGLGLTICKTLSKVLGGAITVSSIKGRGSKFTINLNRYSGSISDPKLKNAT